MYLVIYFVVCNFYALLVLYVKCMFLKIILTHQKSEEILLIKILLGFILCF